jgi:hypothetical protein
VLFLAIRYINDSTKDSTNLAKAVKIVSFNGQYRITLPKVLVELKGWKKGMKLAITQCADGSINLRAINEQKNQ